MGVAGASSPWSPLPPLAFRLRLAAALEGTSFGGAPGTMRSWAGSTGAGSRILGGCWLR
jgi:hypothetical protein